MLHDAPNTAAERLALHLEQNYGLQLDAGRHRALIADLERYMAEDAMELGAAYRSAGDIHIPGNDTVIPDVAAAEAISRAETLEILGMTEEDAKRLEEGMARAFFGIPDVAAGAKEQLAGANDAQG